MSTPSPAPLFHIPIMDFALLLNPLGAQTQPKTMCARIERRLAGCLEAYGYGKKGKEKCKDLFYDFHECQHFNLQLLRYRDIRNQRMKLYKEGKLDKPFDEHPPIDGLIYYESV